MKNDREISVEIAKEVDRAGGAAYYVGGCVRDELLGKENKDFDIEVYGITPGQLRDICGRFGHVGQ